MIKIRNGQTKPLKVPHQLLNNAVCTLLSESRSHSFNAHIFYCHYLGQVPAPGAAPLSSLVEDTQGQLATFCKDKKS